MDRDEGLPVSMRLEMCLAERERVSSGCRAAGLTIELPVHVVLVPPPSLGVVVTKFKLRSLGLLVSATALSSRRFFSRFCSTGGIGLQARTIIRRTPHETPLNAR